MEQTLKRRLRLPALLTVVGGSSVVASLFSPARAHGVIDVISIAAASGSYTYLVTSIVLANPSKGIKRWFGGGRATRTAERVSFIACCVSGSVYVTTIWFPIVLTLRRLDPYGPHVPTVPAAITAAFGLGLLLVVRANKDLNEWFVKFIVPLTLIVFLAATVQFITAAKLLVNLRSLHGAYLILVASVGFAALIYQAWAKRGLNYLEVPRNSGV